MVQLPAAINATVLPPTVHMAVVCDAKATGRPEDAVAVTVNGPLFNGRSASAPKVIAWLIPAIPIANDWVASGGMPLLAVSIPANVPTELGVPLIRPVVAFRASPGGNAFAWAANVGAGDPDAVTV
jgi:hypothetical protein